MSKDMRDPSRAMSWVVEIHWGAGRWQRTSRKMCQQQGRKDKWTQHGMCLSWLEAVRCFANRKDLQTASLALCFEPPMNSMGNKQKTWGIQQWEACLEKMGSGGPRACGDAKEPSATRRGGSWSNYVNVTGFNGIYCGDLAVYLWVMMIYNDI